MCTLTWCVIVYAFARGEHKCFYLKMHIFQRKAIKCRYFWWKLNNECWFFFCLAQLKPHGNECSTKTEFQYFARKTMRNFENENSFSAITHRKTLNISFYLSNLFDFDKHLQNILRFNFALMYKREREKMPDYGSICRAKTHNNE